MPKYHNFKGVVMGHFFRALKIFGSSHLKIESYTAVRWWCSSGLCNGITISKGPGFDSRVQQIREFPMLVHLVHTVLGITSPWRAIFGWATATLHMAIIHEFPRQSITVCPKLCCCCLPLFYYWGRTKETNSVLTRLLKRFFNLPWQIGLGG